LVFETVEVDAALRADATIGHGKQRTGDKIPLKPAIIDVGREGDDVLDDAAPDRDD
jgi:hypothetical protein